MKHQLAKKLVLYSVLGTIVAMVFMAGAIVFPHPLVLVLAMSIGQGIAILALTLFLPAVALDLQSSGGGGYVTVEEPTVADSGEPPAAEG